MNQSSLFPAAAGLVAAATLTLLPGAPAAAQDVTVRLTHDDDDSVILVGESVTWTLEIQFVDYSGSSVASSTNMEILADNTLGVSSDFTYTPAHADTGEGFNGGTNGGTSNGAGVGFINFTNWICIECDFFPRPSYANPLVVGDFEFTATNTGTLDYTFADGQASSPFVEIQLNAFASNLYSIDEVAFDIDTLTIVPSPGALALFALAIPLVFSRRHR